MNIFFSSKKFSFSLLFMSFWLWTFLKKEKWPRYRMLEKRFLSYSVNKCCIFLFSKFSNVWSVFTRNSAFNQSSWIFHDLLIPLKLFWVFYRFPLLLRLNLIWPSLLRIQTFLFVCDLTILIFVMNCKSVVI